MLVIKYNFGDLQKSSKIMILDQKSPIYPILGIIKIFFKTQRNHFNSFLMPVQFQKNLMNRLREKFKSVDFGPKNDLFHSFWG